jgi:hypothetical protein
MNTTITLIVCAACLAAADQPPAADAAATRGTVLVLENEAVITGDIERVGELYHVRRLIGETTVPGDRVLRLCASMEDAYDFVRGRANLTDPDERLRVAEWCRLNGLHAQALAEVQAAVALRPEHAPSRRLLAYLQESGPAKPAPATSHDEPPPEAPPVQIDLTEEALGQFASKVQPILMNACASCHANGRGGAFKLTRAYDTAVLNRKTLQQNLAAVLGEVNLGQPQNSLLLAKAVSVHGPQEQAPIRNRQAAAYRTLEEWVKNTAAENPQLRDQAPPRPAAATPFAEARPASLTDQSSPQKTENSPLAPPVAHAPASPGVKEAPEPPDLYSPDPFNRQYHDQKAKPAPRPMP